MLNRRVILTASSVLILVAIVLGLFLIKLPSGKASPNEPEQRTSAMFDLGIAYIPVTPRISVYHNLGINSGALVTEVAPDSPAEKVGVKVGDVIVSFNGSKVEEETPLLGMMMACTAGNSISLEVHSGMNIRMVEIAHSEQ